ncbi:hypothetical protein SCLCIDRAFT_1187377 [Scleroderma citrinum Foug A]|uniref:Uncharacterized protein n=1 Tax=Scleroderma citrinum Foug A TaxID=1036808 RepID=A0A0C3D1Z0_9AGAM|nr:hypothetical protein SCLCIDRAFT_1187377 [Scleroderma citrinum Foug A]
MTKWLDRQEKIEIFCHYLDHQLEEDALNTTLTRKIVLAKQPAVHVQPISTIKEHHSAPYFSRDLKCFLNTLLPHGETIPCTQLQHAELGLSLQQLDVWHSYKLQMDALGNDVDSGEEKETIKAKPGDKGRFNMVVVAHSAAVESTGKVEST